MSFFKKSIIDIASVITITATFVLFAAAAFTKGWTHDLLLETGVFMVSVKLILSAYKTNERLERIERLVSCQADEKQTGMAGEI
jgi:hypothetical protein